MNLLPSPGCIRLASGIIIDLPVRLQFLGVPWSSWVGMKFQIQYKPASPLGRRFLNNRPI